MGAPKQKWTAEEEAALKAGVHKHGAGKWQTILRDPAFEDVLRSRSNVDLKDKWRNINVTLSGLGSREKARLALKRNPQIPKLGDKAIVADTAKVDEKAAEARPVLPSDPVQVADSKKAYTRLDTVILEAITTLKEPKGSDKNAIAMYIEERYQAPANFSMLLNSKLKSLTASGRLLKVKHKYRISTSVPASEPGARSPSDSKPMDRPRSQRKELKLCTRPEVVADLEKMKCMSAQEAAAAAAQAVAQAEAAIAEAEKAAREAEAAEAEADAARAFAEAAMKALKCQKLRAC
ncbi:single myb histone 1-like [Silene latifolia]|uniref:single myb histone 1-like n=1 Tax=Silene latifolia TaxID=37657 RepID=UPI003D77071B